jgi:hypothetical protein
MDSETIQVKMSEQIGDVKKIAEPYGWAIERTGLSVYIEMRHRRKPDDAYLLRVAFEDYPRRAPSYVFVDKETKNPGSWPPNVKHGSDPPGICTPGTRECIEYYHKGDAKYQWDHNKYTFRFVMMEIQKLLEQGIG